MLSINCPRCGATNVFDETKQIPTFCAFCGSHLPDMTDFVKRSLNLNVDRHYFSMNMQHMDKDIERIDREIKREQVRNVGAGIKAFIKGIDNLVIVLFFIFILILVIKSL